MGLVGEAEATVINPHYIASISQPPNSLGELREMGSPKCVVIMHDAPDIQSLPVAVTNILHFVVWDISIQKARHGSIFFGANTRLALRNVRRFYKNEIWYRPSEPPSRIEDYIVTVAILGGIGCLAYLAFKGKTR